MARRLKNILVNTEYTQENKRRLRNVVVNAEYSDLYNKRRLRNIVVMVEYVQNAAPANEFGPKCQMMG